MGATASGKTSLALDLAHRLDPSGECIVADSMQIYRGMNIGTASPTALEQSQVPHHLLDIVEPGNDGFTVANFAELANAAIDDIRARGRTPIIVGGTHLYIRALLEGVFEGPKGDPTLRAELAEQSVDQLRVELETCDPLAAETIHPNDRRRTVRAIEVFRLTGKPISSHQQEWAESITPRIDAMIVGLDWEAEPLNRRINERVREMMQQGFLEEVQRLREGSIGVQAAEAVGYRELLGVLEQTMSLETAIERIKIRSRRYAKQQRTWLRRFKVVPQSLWLEAQGQSAEELGRQAADWICAELH